MPQRQLIASDGDTARVALISTSAFQLYCTRLREWLDVERVDTDDETTLVESAIALCETAKHTVSHPEQMLIALHDVGLPAAATPQRQVVYERRYIAAVRLLLRAYFGEKGPPRPGI
jgi:hypothetical protein